MRTIASSPRARTYTHTHAYTRSENDGLAEKEKRAPGRNAKRASGMMAGIIGLMGERGLGLGPKTAAALLEQLAGQSGANKAPGVAQ